MLLALSVFWTERPWWKFLGVFWFIVPYTKLSVWVGLSSWNQNTVVSSTVTSKYTKPPFCPHDRVSEWVGQSSVGKVTESQPHAEQPSAPLSPFYTWGWNLDRAAGTPKCRANGSHRLGSNTAGAWMSAMATMTERHSATMSEQLFSELLLKMTWS